MRKTLLLCLIFFSACKSIDLPLVSKVHKKKTHTKTRDRLPSRTEGKTRTVSSDHIRSAIVDESNKYLGIPYVYGGKKPSTGFDCSGFSTFVFSMKGQQISGSSAQLATLGELKPYKFIEKGDLAFFGSENRVSHVAIVVEKTNHSFKVVHATSSRGVIVSDIHNSAYWKGKYLFTRDLLNKNDYGHLGLVH